MKLSPEQVDLRVRRDSLEYKRDALAKRMADAGVAFAYFLQVSTRAECVIARPRDGHQGNVRIAVGIQDGFAQFSLQLL